MYADREERVTNSIKPDVSNLPHLILYDGNGTARFALRYKIAGGCITILSLQRERTQYTRKGPGFFWNAEAETAASKKFRQALGGMHPAEFLLSQFIFEHREQVRKYGLSLRVPAYASVKEYKPLITRFFASNGREVFGGTVFNLAKTKKRPRQILGI